MGAACLICAIGFAALSVDTSLIVMTRTHQQNAVDAAALAAAEEIAIVIESASGGASSTAVAAENAARATAQHVASLNGVYVDPQRDVKFGKRYYDNGAKLFRVDWNGRPFNAVKVTARRENANPNAPDAALNLFFAPFFGTSTQKLVTNAAAFVEARDLVLVLDYTGSMNDDSTLFGIDRLGRSAVEANMLQIYSQLGLNLPNLPNTPVYPVIRGAASNGPNIDVTFKGNAITAKTSNGSLKKVKLYFNNGNTQEWNTNGNNKSFTGTGSNAQRYVYRAEVTTNDNRTATIEYTIEDIKKDFGLDKVNYPYPSGSWDDFVYQNFYQSYVGLYYNYQPLEGYEWKFGKLSLVHYLLEYQARHDQTPDLWKTSHYPFHAMKNGAGLLCDFLRDLQFGDHLGLVTYDESSRVETVLNMPSEGISINISAKPITDDYTAIDIMQRHKQAGHYASRTGIGYGLDRGIQLLQSNGRYGARPTLLLMTDGNANEAPSGFKLPNNWDWAALTDYDGDGAPDYQTNDVNKQYAFFYAKQAADLGYTIHTMTVGSDGDRSFMRAIAFAGGGTYIDVPGGTSTAAMESQLRVAFNRIAAKVPPAKLLIERN